MGRCTTCGPSTRRGSTSSIKARSTRISGISSWPPDGRRGPVPGARPLPSPGSAAPAKILEAALWWESRLALRDHEPRVTAVTGSVGKTTTKDLIAAVLAQRYVVRKSPGNYNWGIHVPLAILGLRHALTNSLRWSSNLLRGFGSLRRRNRPDRLVLEIAAARPGDLERIGRWLPTDIVVLTRFPEVPMHLG